MFANKEKVKDLAKEGEEGTWCQHVWWMQVQLRILGAELQNGGRSRDAEKAGCEKQGGPLPESWQLCKENSLTDESGSFVVLIVAR